MAVLNALNGRLPGAVLTGLPWAEAAGFRLRADAAASAGRLATAFRAHFAAPLLLTDAYRTLATQVALRASKGVWAAAPGTSNHGLGIAIDFASGINVDGSVQHLWMTANAGRFGWVNPAWAVNYNPLDGQHEPWHWEFDPARDQHATITTTPEADMPLSPEDIVAVNGVVLRMWREPEITNIIAAAAATAAANQWASAETGNTLRGAVLAIFREPEITNIIRAATAQATTAGTLDLAALAKAVNDDAARRLAT